MIETKTREETGPATTRRDGACPAPGAAAPSTDERARAVLYLDLWERHVAGTAIGGRGIAAPWFAR